MLLCFLRSLRVRSIPSKIIRMSEIRINISWYRFSRPSFSICSCFAANQRWMRIAILISGQLLAANALILILLLPLDAFIRGAACAACWTFSRIELKRLRQGFDSCVEIRLFAGGEALIRDHGRQWQPATLLTGSRIRPVTLMTIAIVRRLIFVLNFIYLSARIFLQGL